jgi:hypothetical protein
MSTECPPLKFAYPTPSPHAGDGKRYTLRLHLIQLAVEMVTPCTSILLAVEMDTPCTSILLAVEMDTTVERLYCKRPILCLASSQILTPHPPHRPASVYPPAFGAGGGHTRWLERGVGGQYFGRRQTQLCTLYVHTAGVGERDSHCTSKLQLVESDKPWPCTYMDGC